MRGNENFQLLMRKQDGQNHQELPQPATVGSEPKSSDSADSTKKFTILQRGDSVAPAIRIKDVPAPALNSPTSSKNTVRQNKNKLKKSAGAGSSKQQQKLDEGGLTQNNVKILKRNSNIGASGSAGNVPTEIAALENEIKKLNVNGSVANHHNSRKTGKSQEIGQQYYSFDSVQEKPASASSSLQLKKSVSSTSQKEHSAVAVYFENTGKEASFLIYKDERFVTTHYVCRSKLQFFPQLKVGVWYAIIYKLQNENSIHMNLISIEKLDRDPPLPTRTTNSKAEFLISAEVSKQRNITCKQGTLQFGASQMFAIKQQKPKRIFAWCQPLGGTKEEALKQLKVVGIEGKLKNILPTPNSNNHMEAIVKPTLAKSLLGPKVSDSDKLSSPSQSNASNLKGDSQSQEHRLQRHTPHFLHDLVIYSEENAYGGKMSNFVVFNPKKRRFTDVIKLEKWRIPLNAELRLGNWYNLRYRFEEKKGKLEVNQITRYSRRYPTKVIDGRVMICVIATKNNNEKRKRKNKEVAVEDSSKMTTIEEDSETVFEPKLFSETPSETASESMDNNSVEDPSKSVEPIVDVSKELDSRIAVNYCKYKCSLGMLEAVPRALLLEKHSDDAERESDGGDPEENSAETTDGVVTTEVKWPDKMLIWCELRNVDRYLYLALIPFKIDEILDDDEESCGEEFESFFGSSPEDVDYKVPALSNAFICILDDTISKLYQMVRITDQKRMEIEKFVEKLRSILQSNLQSTELSITPFGSVVNGFGWMNCDLDLCLQIKNRVEDQKQLIGRVGSCLRYCQKKGFIRVNTILDARIPIVKFHHISGIHGDVSIDNILPQHNSKLLATYANFDPRVAPLGLFVKQWAKQLGINNNATGSLSSYAYVVMLVHFFQQCKPPVLPFLQDVASTSTIEQLSQEHPVIRNKYNVNFIEDTTKLKTEFSKNLNLQTTSALFYDFLLYYTRKFDPSQEIIQIRQRSPLTKEQKGLNNVRRLWIEDPFDLDHNLTAGVKAKGLRLLMNGMRKTLMELHSQDKMNRGNNELSLSELIAAVKRRRPSSSIQAQN